MAGAFAAQPGFAVDDPSAACAFALEARFVESAPRDRFVVALTAGDDRQLERLEIDLTGSAGRLIFDTEAGGTGVEVFQPFRVERGEALLVAAEVPEDGGERIVFTFSDFIDGAAFTFSIDVDDRLPASDLGQIRVAGAEIEGAQLVAAFGGSQSESVTASGHFTADAMAVVEADCR